LDQAFERHGAGADAESPLWMRFHLGKAAQNYQRGNLDAAQSHLSFCEKGVRSSGIEIDLEFFCALKAMLALALDATAASSAKSLLLQGVAESALFAAFAFPSLELIGAAFPAGTRL